MRWLTRWCVLASIQWGADCHHCHHGTAVVKKEKKKKEKKLTCWVGVDLLTVMVWWPSLTLGSGGGYGW